MMTAPDLLESPETELMLSPDLPWLVVVHNDPVNLMSYVALVFRRIFGWSRERAERHMMEVHTKGRSVVWSGGREQAEHYVQQLHAALLLARIEKSD
jgi:ATP-dependent Clp protease adaptor protein ClpS